MSRKERIILLNPNRLVFGLGSFDQFIKDSLDLEHKRMFLITIPPMADQLKEALVPFQSAGVTICRKYL